MFGNITFFQQMQQGMRWAAARAKVLTENLQNQETPGYKAKDLASLGEFRALHATGLQTTNPLHIRPRTTVEGFRMFETNTEPSLSGNTVHSQEQMTALTDTSFKYMTWVNLSKSLSSRGVSAIQSLV